MFSGEYFHSIDSKGRVIVPVKLREALGDSFVVTAGLDGCLYMYSNEEWNSFADKLKTLPESKKETRQIQRYFFARAVTCELDKQGRILIPAKLREHAKLVKEVAFIGLLSKVEIWDKETWDNLDKDNEADIADKIDEFELTF